MENLTGPMSRWSYGPEMAFGSKSWGVVINSDLAAGILLATSLAGLLTYYCAFWDQRANALSLFKKSFIMSFSCEHVNLRGAQNTHVSVFALIFVDVVNVIGAVTLGSHLAAGSCPENTCFFTYNLWTFSRRYLVMIHLLTALISLLYLCYPHLGAKLRCVFSLVSLLICVLHYSAVVYTIEALYIQEALTCALGVGIIATSCLRGRKKDKLRIIVVAMITFLVVYFPSFVLDYLIYSRIISGLPVGDYHVIYMNVYFFTNLNIILDGLLCYSILKLSAAEGAGEDQEQQPQQWELQPRGQQQPQKYQQQQQQEQHPRQQQQQQQQQPWQQQQQQQEQHPRQQQQQQQQQPWQQQQQQPRQQQQQQPWQQQQQQPWQQQQQQPWQQQQQPWRQQQQPQTLDFPRVHVNEKAVDDYNKENWD